MNNPASPSPEQPEQPKPKGFFRRRGAGLKNRVETLVDADSIREQQKTIQDLWSTATKGARTKPRREETFANAYLRLELTEERLSQVHKSFTFRFYLFLFFTIAAIAVTINNVVNGAPVALGPSMGFLAISTSLMVQASFRLYQIQRRELVDMHAWWNDKGAWIPAPFKPRGPSGKQPQGARAAGAARLQKSTGAGSKPSQSPRRLPRSRTTTPESGGNDCGGGGGG